MNFYDINEQIRLHVSSYFEKIKKFKCNYFNKNDYNSSLNKMYLKSLFKKRTCWKSIFEMNACALILTVNTRIFHFDMRIFQFDTRIFHFDTRIFSVLTLRLYQFFRTWCWIWCSNYNCFDRFFVNLLVTFIFCNSHFFNFTTLWIYYHLSKTITVKFDV